MREFCTLCGIEPISENSGQNLCETCGFNLFQINQILDTYMKDRNPPSWISEMLCELDFIYERNLRTKAYFNVAQEIIYRFSVEKESDFPLDDIKEINQSQIPRHKIITILETAYLAEIKDFRVYPGALTRKLQNIRWEGYELNALQMILGRQEIRGVLSIALTRALIETKEFVPREALSILNLLSLQMLETDGEIEREIRIHRQRIAFARITPRQVRFLVREMGGFGSNSRAKICKDIDDERNLILKDIVIDYLTRMRERWRERERERIRE